MQNKEKREKRLKRKTRIRHKIKGTEKRPRISVFRSNNHLFVQMIDDVKGETVVSASDSEALGKSKKMSKKDISFMTGELLAKKAIDKKIKEAVFDKGGYKYHGRIQSLVEGVRKGGVTV